MAGVIPLHYLADRLSPPLLASPHHHRRRRRRCLLPLPIVAAYSSSSSTRRVGTLNFSVSKSLMMYGSDGAGGLASSTNQLEDIEHFGDVVSLDDKMDSFLSHDGEEGRDLYGTLKPGLTEHKTESSNDGKLLAKVILWSMDTLKTETTPEEHQYLITDVRFRPNSSQLATASFDKSVRLWDAANPSYCLNAYTGHPNHVISLDFHPKKNDLFCFCDSNNEIRYWNINPFTCARVSKQGGRAHVRFQPISGHVLAAASDKVVSTFDVETDRQTHTFQGHSGVVNYLCWDLNGDYLASVSEESVKVWSLTSKECIHELSSNGSQFHSCVFHPSYSALLVIGGMRSLELWNMAENKSMTISGHDNIIAALAESPVTGMVASASLDSSVKLWK
ncbi:unnamed protein product [Camellia sinensis]